MAEFSQNLWRRSTGKGSMAVRWGFDIASFVHAWPGPEKFSTLPRPLEEITDERRMGVATLALLGSRGEYWIALGLIAGYAQEEDQSIPQLLERLAPTGELSSAGARQLLSWANQQPFMQEIGGVRGPVIGAVYAVATAIRPEALAAAADAATAFQLCYDAYQPDMDRVMACYLEQISQ
jgi:hypothetical protein